MATPRVPSMLSQSAPHPVSLPDIVRNRISKENVYPGFRENIQSFRERAFLSIGHNEPVKDFSRPHSRVAGDQRSFTSHAYPLRSCVHGDILPFSANGGALSLAPSSLH